MSKMTKINRQKQEQMNSIYTDHSTDKREYYKTFYDILLKNKGKDLNELFEALNKILGKYDVVTRENIGKKLGEMGKLYPDKSNEALYILNLGVGISNNSIEKIKKYSKLLKDIEDKREFNKSRAEANKINRISTDKHGEKLEKLNKLMDNVLNNKDIPSNLFNERYDLLDFARKNMNLIDQEKYIDFLIKYKNLDGFDIDELIKLRESIKYFSVGVKTTSDKLSKLDLDKASDLETFNQINVAGKEKLDPNLAKYPKRVYAWEQSRLDKYAALYENYEKMLDLLIDKKDVNAYKTLNQTDKSTLELDYDFLREYASEFKAISDCFSGNIMKITSTNDVNKNKMIKLFTNKMIRENDDEKNL